MVTTTCGLLMQAMAAYRTAERLFSGLHLPLLGMGMEYHRMSNLPLAEQLFRQAHAICPADALVCNELGALAFRNNKFSEAEEWFAKAIEHMPEVAPPGLLLLHLLDCGGSTGFILIDLLRRIGSMSDS